MRIVPCGKGKNTDRVASPGDATTERYKDYAEDKIRWSTWSYLRSALESINSQLLSLNMSLLEIGLDRAHGHSAHCGCMTCRSDQLISQARNSINEAIRTLEPRSKAPGSTAPGSTAPGSTAPGSTAPGSTAPGPKYEPPAPGAWYQLD